MGTTCCRFPDKDVLFLSLGCRSAAFGCALRGLDSRLIPFAGLAGRKVFSDGKIDFALVKDISKGDILAAYTGEKIVLDGIVTQGEGACDESLMTGEAIPVMKRGGDTVLTGTIVSHGQLYYRVTSTQEETALQKIISTVEQDIGHKSVYLRAADTIVRWFVPAVIAIAGLTWLTTYYLYSAETAFLRALAVLLISCPCAIGIAAPTVESYLLTNLAALGVIVRNRGALPFLGREDVIVFDKTGTITEGRYQVQSSLDHLSNSDKKGILSLASRSTHPVACAIAKLKEEHFDTTVEELTEIIGYGLQGRVENDFYHIGSERFLQQEGIAVPLLEPSLMTHVYTGKNGHFLTVIILGDQIRTSVKDTLQDLKSSKTILLSGDREEPVSRVAQACGFDEWKALCTPLEKRDFIEKLRDQEKVVCMVGDGINDAPALTAATIGISVVSASDMSIQVSDILLTTDRLDVLVKMRKLAREGAKIIRQNLFWAFAFNVVGIFLATFGWLSPIFAAAAMSLSSLIVLFNARRLAS